MKNKKSAPRISIMERVISGYKKIRGEDRIPKELKIGKNYLLTWGRKGQLWKFMGVYKSGNRMVLMQSTKYKNMVRSSRESVRNTEADSLSCAIARLDAESK